VREAVAFEFCIRIIYPVGEHTARSLWPNGNDTCC
jgi:hypothetical protein